MNELTVDSRKLAQFGRRRVVPRACVVDAKPHIRTFLSDKLEELGFIAHHCGRATDMHAALADYEPDLVILGLLKPESDVTKTLQLMAVHHFSGRVMLFGGRASTALLALHDLGEQLGLAMLPPLRTPFRDGDLNENLSPLLPIAPAPSLDVDVEEALRNGWLELWYQPRINLQEMTLCGAEALVRMRHPTWGVVLPASFIPSENDPGLVALSEFVVERAMADWTTFSRDRRPMDMMIHLPATVLEQPAFIEQMCVQIPDHAAFSRLVVEISSVDVCRNHAWVREAARHLQTYNVGISIDDVMAEASWVDVADFPIAELQVEGDFINGCAEDRQKRAACQMVVDLAGRLQARTAAKGIERTEDCRTVCKMGFDIGQGFLFAKPMEMHRFARTMLRQHSAGSR